MARKMRDSGIEWIGAIPEGWSIARGKHILTLLQRAVFPTDGVITCFRDGEVTLRSNRREDGFTVSLKEIGYQGIEPGDLVVHGMDGFAGSIGISDSRGKSSPVLVVLDSSQDKKYLMYYLRSMAYNNVFLALSTGIRVRSCDLKWNKLADLLYLVPPIVEQHKLVSFLDEKCSEIDAMLSKTRSSIEEYKKLKQAVITQAVTKGVRGKREMKDSGVEWISEIPANWTVKRGKQLFSETNERSETGSEELLTVSHITGVTPRSQKNVNMFMSESLVGYKICHNGDLAANTMWMWQGAIGVSKFHGVISPSYNTYRQKTNDYYFEYLDYLLRIRPLIDAYTIHSTGIALSRLRLYPDSFLSLYFIVPPITEQKEIADYLDAKCAEIDKLIAKKEQLVKELESYKKSLIYEVVTGKREV